MQFVRVSVVIVALLLGWVGLRAEPAILHGLMSVAALGAVK